MKRREIEKKVFDLIIVGSPRVKFHPVIVSTRHTISPGLCNNIEFVSFDEKLYRSLVVCKHCHLLFNNQRWNRNVISRHLDKFHGIDLNAVDDDGDKTAVKPRSQVAQYQYREASIKNRKRAHKDTEKVPQPETVPHQSTVPSDQPQCEPKQSNEDGVQDIKLDNLIDVVSESIPAQDMGQQFAIAQESEAAHTQEQDVAHTKEQEVAHTKEQEVAQTQVYITDANKVGDQVDFCSTIVPRKTKSECTRKKGAGGTRRDGKGSARGKEDRGGDASESESKASP